MEDRAKLRLILSAVALGVGVPAFMAAVSCLPNISTAGVAPFDAGDAGNPPTPSGFCGDGIIDFDAGEHCDPADGAAPGCNACQIMCDGGLLDPATDHCYLALPSVAKIEAARAECENTGGHLVTFVSETEFANVLAWKKADFWVGLNLDTVAAPPTYVPFGSTVMEPGWSRNCDGCYAHVDGSARDIPRLLPDASGPKPTCVLARAAIDQSWVTVTPDLGVGQAAVVCEREPVGTTARFCNQPTCVATRGTPPHRYQYFPEAVTAQEAADRCTSNGARLVVFETREGREQLARELASFLPPAPIPEIWIGLVRGKGGTWAWADGAPVTQYPLEWGDNQPSGANTAFAYISLSTSAYDTQLAHADDGTTPRPYLCELAN